MEERRRHRCLHRRTRNRPGTGCPRPRQGATRAVSQPGCHHSRAASACGTLSAGTPRGSRSEPTAGAERRHLRPSPAPLRHQRRPRGTPLPVTAQGHGGAAVAGYVPTVPAVGLYESLPDHKHLGRDPSLCQDLLSSLHSGTC